MKNEHNWVPTKYIMRNGNLIASRDTSQVRVGSRLMADLVAREYQRSLPLMAKGRLLDLGCGQAPLYQTYRPLVTSVTCVDWENSPHQTDHIDTRCDLSKPLSLADGGFDTVILSDVLEHIPEPKLLLSEINRILAADGVLIMNVPFYYCIHEAPYDFYRYTHFALRKLLVASNFDSIHVEPIGGSLEVMSDILSKHIQFIPVIGTPIASAIHLFAAFLSKTKLGLKAKKATGENFPFGYFITARKTSDQSQP